MARLLIILLVIGLAHTPAAAIQPGIPPIALVVGTLNWDNLAAPGLAVIVVSDRVPNRYSFFLFGPPTWNDGKAVELYADFTPISDRRGFKVWWYVFPEKRPAQGEYRIEATFPGMAVKATARLGAPSSLPRPSWVVANIVDRNEINAVWSPVPGAKSYAVTILTPAHEPVPHDATQPPNHAYTTFNSLTMVRTTRLRSYRRSWPYRLELFAFNVDLTGIPTVLPENLKASWKLSPAFDFP